MAPDLHNVPRSSHPSRASNTNVSSRQDSPNPSRRTSSVMGPPPVPQNSSLPNSPRLPSTTSMDNAAFAASTGPIRHPRPLTAAELHLELEKEQESIVNRLTRELSALRAQTASVASTTSSTSDLFTSNQNDPYLYSYGAPNIIPTSARRHRSSSNLSSRSARSTRDTLNATAGATSVSGVAAPRDRDRERERDRDHGQSQNTTQSHQTSSRPSIEIPRPDISRQDSMSGSMGAHRTTSNTASSPHWSHTTHPRHSVSSSISTNYQGGAGSGEPQGRSPSASMTSINAQARYEEAALQRAELDAVKRENEALKSRIRELEKSLSEKSSLVNSNAGGHLDGMASASTGEGGGGAAVTS